MDAVIGSPLTTFLAALWVSRRVESRLALHGAMAGTTAMVIYLIILALSGQFAVQPVSYWVAHGLKILGGAAGGMFAARQMANASSVARAGV